MTANINTMIQRTKIRLDSEGIVLAMMIRISLSDFQDLANLKTLNKRKDLSIESPLTPSKSNSTIEKATMTKSKQFQLS